MEKIRVGDEVVVRSGVDRGKRGSVLRKVGGNRVVIEGVNLGKKHQKARPDKGTPGGIIEKEQPIHISNVALHNPISGRADRVSIRRLADGRKVRVFKSDGELVEAE